ncbi:MAG TPA: sugar phosphate isomerase/epimerase family protein [Bryobacteraceae bacterium]|nr:sugar phosphate isomerase/epimerase family protein [Bryobacteraceae bacterium]
MSSTISRRALLAGVGAAALPLPAKIGQVEIGVCGSVDDFDKAEQFGFDYYEPAVAAVAALSDQAFADFAKRVAKSRIKCECFNSFIRTLVVVGPAVDRDALTAYVNSALDRCRALGGTIVVWGSAGSRNVPEGFPRERAWQQIVAFLKMAGPLAESRNITIAIEPLRHQESNIINTGAEAFRMVREVDHPNVKMIIDYYHLAQEHEDPQILETARDAIVHLHFANPAGRVWPKDPAEDPGYAPFFAEVKKIGFRGGLSIEGRGTFEADAAASLAFFRKELT